MGGSKVAARTRTSMKKWCFANISIWVMYPERGERREVADQEVADMYAKYKSIRRTQCVNDFYLIYNNKNKENSCQFWLVMPWSCLGCLGCVGDAGWRIRAVRRRGGRRRGGWTTTRRGRSQRRSQQRRCELFLGLGGGGLSRAPLSCLFVESFELFGNPVDF